jgi:hypothetical protein
MPRRPLVYVLSVCAAGQPLVEPFSLAVIVEPLASIRSTSPLDNVPIDAEASDVRVPLLYLTMSAAPLDPD